jgi:hypothetical protein
VVGEGAPDLDQGGEAGAVAAGHGHAVGLEGLAVDVVVLELVDGGDRLGGGGWGRADARAGVSQARG